MAVTIELEDVSLGPRMAQLAPEQLEKAWASSRGCIESLQDMPTNTVQACPNDVSLLLHWWHCNKLECFKCVLVGAWSR